ncbi:MAG TPA: hypothetical protein VGN09_29350 [Vicinamibacteria bacterium]|jgi:hypothetical protein
MRRRPGLLRLLWRVLGWLGLTPAIERHVIPVFLDASTSAATNAEREAVKRCEGALEALAGSSHRVLVGPWTSEVGFELLYWIPFLRWAFARYGIAPERAVAVSRGGASPWYGGLAATYVDAFELLSPAEFKEANQKRVREIGQQKQSRKSDLDGAIAEKVQARLGSDDLDWLHPSLMYQLFSLFWEGRATARLVEAHTTFARLPAVPPDGLPVPATDYAAVKFYASDYLPATPENGAFVGKVVRRLADTLPVVVLNTGLDLDDHAEWSLQDHPNVHRLAPGLDARSNLAVQTAIVARARAFVGTYGGFAYLAPFCGVPAVSFYSRANALFPVHLDVAQRACFALGPSSEVLALNVASAEAALGSLVVYRP